MFVDFLRLINPLQKEEKIGFSIYIYCFTVSQICIYMNSSFGEHSGQIQQFLDLWENGGYINKIVGRMWFLDYFGGKNHILPTYLHLCNYIIISI